MRSSLDQSGAEELWPQLAPHLEETMSRLRAADRELLALRFYENKNAEEVAALLGIGTAAAHKRTKRALEKLQKLFAARGVTSTTAAIAGAVSANAMPVASIGLAKTISGIAIAQGAAASASTLTLINGALKIMAWTKAKTTIVVGIGILFAAGITTVGFKNIHPGEPSYDGKTLTAWLEASKNLVFVGTSDTQADQCKKHAELQKTYDAVQHIGPRAIPILLKWVANTTNGGGHILAAGCIQKLGPEAKTAVPGLIAILDSTNVMERYSSFNVLQRIGSAADPALPAILDHIRYDTSDGMRSFSLTTLANSGIGKQNPEVVVPILIECLASTNKAILRGESLRALAGLGASAKSAVPAILPYLKGPDLELRNAARNALSQIDPPAAASM